MKASTLHDDGAAFGANIFGVFGAAKSGTTWVQKLLDSHPDIRCHFQLRLFPFSATNKRRFNTPSQSIVYSGNLSPFKGVFEGERAENEYWLQTDVMQEFPAFMEEALDKAAARYEVSEDSKREVYNTLYKRFVEALVWEPDKKLIGTKAYIDFEKLFGLYPDAKCVAVVRDGRDVCVSKRFHLARRGVFFHGDERTRLHYALNRSRRVNKILRRYKLLNEGNFEIPKVRERVLTPEIVDKLARDWVNVNEYILEWQASYANHILLVRYEDLLDDTHTVLKTILEFLEAEADAETIKKIIEENSFERVKTKGGEGFYRQGTQGDWQRYFNDGLLKRYEAVAGALSKRLGYD